MSRETEKVKIQIACNWVGWSEESTIFRMEHSTLTVSVEARREGTRHETAIS